MSIIYRQVEVVIATQTTLYNANRTLHAEASFPSPDPTREWQVDCVSLQLIVGSGGSDFTLMFYRGATGLARNETGFPSAMVDLGGLRVDGVVRLNSSDSVTSSNAGRRVYSVTPPRRISISSENGVYKFQTFVGGALTLSVATVKLVIGLVSGG